MAAMRGTFFEYWIKPSASGRAGHPGHAYSMLSRPSALYRREKWVDCPFVTLSRYHIPARLERSESTRAK